MAPMIERITANPALLKVFRNSADKNQSYIAENTLFWQSFLWTVPFLADRGGDLVLRVAADAVGVGAGGRPEFRPQPGPPRQERARQDHL